MLFRSLAAAAGMWRARYWAVLGFEFMLGFLPEDQPGPTVPPGMCPPR